MAETIGFGLQGQVANVAASANRIENGLAETNEKLNQVSWDVDQIRSDLDELRMSFERFMKDSAKANTLQKATSELVRVRQELEHNYGKYKIVRETMLGVLQATDLALVKKTTISEVTEELMLSTPHYWLAPCLVAVSAWIGNDRDLANRAIAEAVKRDEEKTALTMALICRRNNRTATCYEWLSIYFSRQNACNFTESNFTYLSAYLNGVFGPDEKHMCDDYIAKWIREIQSNGQDVEKKQIKQWHDYCTDFTVDLDGQFPQMKNCVHEYQDIYDYVCRISSVDAIAQNFSGMKNAKINEQLLKENIDKTLVDLISRYDTKEEPLRKEEKYLLAVRHFDGDVEAAKASILEAEQKQTEEVIDLISQMTNTIVKKGRVSPSKRKTSVFFLTSYIRNGFENYITEKKAAFPNEVTIEVDGWEGKSADGQNVEELQNSFEKAMEVKRVQEQNKVTVSRPQLLTIGAGVLGVAGLIGLFLSLFVGIVLLGGGVALLLSSMHEKKSINENLARINQAFDERIAGGKKQIAATLLEWSKARNLVKDFESQKMPDIVA